MGKKVVRRERHRMRGRLCQELKCRASRSTCLPRPPVKRQTPVKGRTMAVVQLPRPKGSSEDHPTLTAQATPALVLITAGRALSRRRRPPCSPAWWPLLWLVCAAQPVQAAAGTCSVRASCCCAGYCGRQGGNWLGRPLGGAGRPRELLGGHCQCCDRLGLERRCCCSEACQAECEDREEFVCVPEAAGGRRRGRGQAAHPPPRKH